MSDIKRFSVSAKRHIQVKRTISSSTLFGFSFHKLSYRQPSSVVILCRKNTYHCHTLAKWKYERIRSAPKKISLSWNVPRVKTADFSIFSKRNLEIDKFMDSIL